MGAGPVTARLSPGDRVVIVGAGPAGLTAAHAVQQAGGSVTVLEATTSIGGISRTAGYNGFRFDLGGHRFFTKSAPVAALWREWLGADLIRVPRLSRIHYRGRYFDYPLRASNALRGLGPIEAVRILASYARATLRPIRREETFEDWVTNRFGRRLYQIFFKTYTEKVWGIPCTEIRAEWAAQRIQNLSLGRAVLRALPLQRRSDAIKSLIEEFDYPRLGPGQMWERVAGLVEDRGARVLLDHRVERIEVDTGRAVAVRARSGGTELRVEADHVISTMALRDLIGVLTPVPPVAVRDAASGLRYRDLLVVALVVDRAPLFPDNWIYVHTPGVRVGRIQNFNNWSSALNPVPGTTCLGLEYFCFEGDALWVAPDAELVALATSELGQLGLAGSARVLDGCVVRVPKAYPIYDATYRERVDAIRRALDQFPNLHTIGRNGMHKYNNQDHSMLAALLLTENMRGARHDLWAVNTDLEYHEEQRLPESGARSQRRP